ncbi:glycosyltransferase [Akkermansia muciniphila]|uniref:glycosyltransferase n=1 Tax=Akkermansia muciniphila TaxID=239935 RepID=UPI001C0620DF|nr:glycosyltransferase [Akkermansia muciniphila]QWO88863.1 glycosyltransferase [Akkermansia muciniphila]
MKIVHLVPSMESGGVEQVVMELGSGLSSRGVENIVVSGGGRLVPRLEKEGSRHILMPIGKKSISTLFRIGALRALLQAVRPDILHLHSRVPAWAGYLAWKSSRRKTAPASSPAFTASTPSTGTPPS